VGDNLLVGEFAPAVVGLRFAPGLLPLVAVGHAPYPYYFLLIIEGWTDFS
jgi:hypothetical protein